MIYREAAREGRLVALPNEVRKFQIQYDEIGQYALPGEQSRELLMRLMKER